MFKLFNVFYSNHPYLKMGKYKYYNKYYLKNNLFIY